MNVVGLDLGTTTLSAVVVDSATGAVRQTLNVPNGADLPPRFPFERIQDADAVAKRALGLVSELKDRHAVDAIGLDGQMHGMLYVDAAGNAVSPLFTWQDQRGETPFEGATCARALSARTGHPMATGYGLTTHFWHVMNAAVPGGAARLCTVYDYVGMKLTGRREPLTHISSAASLGLLDAETGAWDVEAMRRAGMDAGILPEVTDAFALLGTDAGGVTVACGIGDNQASFMGAVRGMSDTVLVNMGTGGQVSMLSGGAVTDPELELRPLGGGRRIVVGSALCGGRAYALLEGFLKSCAALAGPVGGTLYDAMNRAGLEHLDDENLPTVDTRFNGTRANPGLRGMIGNLGTDNFDAPRLIAGTLMGMAREMYGLYGAMLSGGRAPSKTLVGSGNAIRRNPALKRAFEKVFGMEMRIPVHAEEAAYGAALFALVAAGLVGTLDEAQGLVCYRQ